MKKRKTFEILMLLLCAVLTITFFPKDAKAEIGPKPSVRVLFEELGDELCYGTLLSNVRELASIDDPIGKEEFEVAMKCGSVDFRFIRLTENGWYNKSGSEYQGLYTNQSFVTGDVWFAMWMNNDQAYIGNSRYGFPYYNDETIYFAVKVRGDA